MRKIFLAVIILLVAGSLAGTASASTVSFSPSTVTLSPGSTAQVAVVLSDAPAGLAGYECVVNYPSSIVAISSASFPSWASMNRGSIYQGNYVISGVDNGKQVQSGTTDITLATLTLTGVSAGTSTIALSSVTMNGDDGTVLSPDFSSTARVTVSGDAAATTATTTTTSAAATTTTSATATATTTTVAATTTTVTATATATATATGSATATATPAPTQTVPPVVMVTPSIPGGPACGFTSDTIAGSAPLRVSFRDQSSGSPTGWEWSFGDGGTSMAQNPSYLYESPGTYTVSLTVTNEIASTTNTRKAYITVLKPGETLATIAVTPAGTSAAETAVPASSTPPDTPIQRPSATASQSASSILTVIAPACIGIAAIAVALRKGKER